MTTWLKLLPLELQQITDFREPSAEVGKNDNVVGVMSDDLKRLYTLWMVCTREAEQAKLNYRFSDDLRDQCKSREYKFKADALRHIFWTCLNEEFNLWHKSMTSVRKGWQVCWSDVSDEPNLSDFFRKLMED